MANALQKKQASLIAKGGRSAKRKTKVAERRHEPAKMKIAHSHHKSSHSTIKHGNVKMDMRKGRTKKAI